MMRRVRRPSSPALAVQPGAQFCQIDLCHCNARRPGDARWRRPPRAEFHQRTSLSSKVVSVCQRWTPIDSQAPRRADDGLRCRSPGQRDLPSAGRGHRLRADVPARRPGHGQQGPLHAVVAAASRAAPPLLVPPASPFPAVPQQVRRPADVARRSGIRVPQRQAEGRDHNVRRHPHHHKISTQSGVSSATFSRPGENWSKGMLSRVWARKGTRPRIVRDCRYGYACLFSAACPGDRVRGRACLREDQDRRDEPPPPGDWRAGSHGQACPRLPRRSWHRSRELEVPADVFLLRLPPCSPELNRVETPFPVLNHPEFAIRVFESAAHVGETVEEVWKGFARKTGEIKRITARERAVP